MARFSSSLLPFLGVMLACLVFALVGDISQAPAQTKPKRATSSRIPGRFQLHPYSKEGENVGYYVIDTTTGAVFRADRGDAITISKKGSLLP